MTRKIIFIGALRYSGSTMLELILSNDPVGFSVGEMSALYKRKNRAACSCNQHPCPTWEKIRANGLNRAYKSIFEQHPETTFIVDSSKSPVWFSQMQAIAEKMGYEPVHLLIWKDPSDSATSYNKRGYLDKWKTDWTHYHRLYLSSIKDFRTINYRDFVSNPGCLSKICNYLGIEFFENKHEYWNKQHHSIGGNGSTKIHLYDKDSQKFDQINQFMKQKSSDHELENRHRSVYTPEVPEVVQQFVEHHVKGDRLIEDITTLLRQRDVLQDQDVPSPIDLASINPYSASYLWTRSFVSRIKQRFLEK